MAKRQAKDAFGYLPLGNFTRASGFAANTQSRAFNVWSDLKKKHYPRNLALLVGLFLGYCTLAGMKARWLDGSPTARMATLAGPALALGCALEFIVVVTFEANGTAKHFFIFNVAVDLCLLMALLSAGEAAGQLWRRRRGTD
jgi:peptidoglycan/LPS O-acetylase OafA/YrhL